MIDTVRAPASSTGMHVCLVRYGVVPEVARFACTDIEPKRGEAVVVETHRGLLLGTVLERLKPALNGATPSEDLPRIERIATADDLAAARTLARECDDAFQSWCTRILQWELNLELIDLEWTLDRQKQILYVICDRGPDSTKLALQAAAAGLGIIEVQPVSATGLVQAAPSGGSCGSGSCGCSH